MAIFLDNASTTSIDPLVIEEMVVGMKNNIGNPSSIHAEGRNAKAEIEKSKNKIAQLLNCKPTEIIFTSGGTESNNLILYSCLANENIKTVITSKIEHHSVLSTLLALQKKNFFEITYIELTENGDIDLKDLESKLYQSKEKTLVSLMHGNNEIGNLIDLNTVGKLCQKYNALFHSDTVQTIGFYSFNLQNIPINFLTFSAHKIHGPKGVGFIYARNKKNIHPFIFGGGQQLGLRSGTENLHAIMGMRKCLEIAHENMLSNSNYIKELKQYTIENLKANFSKIEFNGGCLNDSSLYKIVNFSLPVKKEMLGFQLDISGICVSQGSACSSGASKPSHVIVEILKDKNNFTPLRISLSKYNTKIEIDYFIKSLIEINKQ